MIQKQNCKHLTGNVCIMAFILLRILHCLTIAPELHNFACVFFLPDIDFNSVNSPDRSDAASANSVAKVWPDCHC
jgi:hypothetical protein